MHVPKENRRKWDSKSKRTCFVGYCEESGNYRPTDLSNPKSIIFAGDVIFLENIRASVDEENVNAPIDFIKASYFGSVIYDDGEQPLIEENEPVTDEVLDDFTVDLSKSDHTLTVSVLSAAEIDGELEIPVQQVEIEPGREIRVRHPPLWLQDYETNFMSIESFVDNCPNSYSNAIEGPDIDNLKKGV
jgi:hypothetical protein